MVALFEDLRAAFPALTMKLELEDPNVDLDMDVPAQAGLSFPINFNLQGDELHLSAGAFWLEWFPLHGLESGRSLSGCRRRAFVGAISNPGAVRREARGQGPLQRPIEGDWQTIGTWADWGALFPWHRSTRVLQNGVLE
jgi:hypothetical protein